ncbi:hypothetical protein BaRGS_00001273 [Batillaria attramentaria]|uniref:Secreted protein n=1 Tax=Batillaria attramentaria TaxID=370345 RepID=A0ABD0M6F1_9CAEN
MALQVPSLAWCTCILPFHVQYLHNCGRSGNGRKRERKTRALSVYTDDCRRLRPQGERERCWRYLKYTHRNITNTAVGAYLTLHITWLLCFRRSKISDQQDLHTNCPLAHTVPPC